MEYHGNHAANYFACRLINRKRLCGHSSPINLHSDCSVVVNVVCNSISQFRPGDVRAALLIGTDRRGDDGGG